MSKIITRKKKTGEEITPIPLLYLGRESNPNLIFRRDLFYPLNYQGKYVEPATLQFHAAKIQQLFAIFKCFIAILIAEHRFFTAEKQKTVIIF